MAPPSSSWTSSRIPKARSRPSGCCAPTRPRATSPSSSSPRRTPPPPPALWGPAPAARASPLPARPPPARAEAPRRAGAGHVFPGNAAPEEVLAEIRRLLALLERAAPRVKVEAPVAIWRDGQPTEGRVTDISSSGFFTATSEPQPVGARLEISFRLPHDRSGKTVTGEVIVVRRADGPNNVAGPARPVGQGREGGRYWCGGPRTARTPASAPASSGFRRTRAS